MANRPIRSEQIEEQYRRLLPAQAGFGTTTDLLASDVIIPVVNITGAAEGQALREDLQRAADISSSTAAFQGKGTATTWISTPGFWKIQINCLINPSTAGAESNTFILDSGATTSSIVFNPGPSQGGGTNVEEYITSPEIVVFLRSGDILRTNHPSATADVTTTLSYRQIADLYGNLTTPNGFVFQ